MADDLNIDAEETDAWITARRWQPVICLSMLVIIGLSSASVLWLVHSQAFGLWFDRQWAEYNGGAPTYAGVYLDSEDRLTLEQLPDLDASRGGVFFFGASNMKWATRFPEMPEEDRRRIHNFGLPAEGSPYYIRQFVKYLVDHKNLLTAGPEKTLIVYGTGLLNMKPADREAKSLFSNMWQRQGLYTYDFDRGVAPASIATGLRTYLFEKAKASSFVQALIDRGGRMLVPKALLRRNISKDSTAYVKNYEARLGSEWRHSLEVHRQELQSLADYLRAEKIPFDIVLLPTASWHGKMPYTAPYSQMIRDFCKQNARVRLIDFSHLLTDDDFFDHIHANDQGLDKLNPKLMELAKGFLGK